MGSCLLLKGTLTLKCTQHTCVIKLLEIKKRLKNYTKEQVDTIHSTISKTSTVHLQLIIIEIEFIHHLDLCLQDLLKMELERGCLNRFVLFSDI